MAFDIKTTCEDDTHDTCADAPGRADPVGHQEDSTGHLNGKGHGHEHTGYLNGKGHHKFHGECEDDETSTVFASAYGGTDGDGGPDPVGHQEDSTGHLNGQGYQHDHIGYLNGEGHQKFHGDDDDGCDLMDSICTLPPPSDDEWQDDEVDPCDCEFDLFT